VDSAEVLTLATELPGVELRENSSWTSITCGGKGFAWVRHDENMVMIKATHEERAACVATDPATFSDGWTSATTAWIRVQLERADPDEVFELLSEGWRMNAPKRVVAAYDAEHLPG
jgi:hypothetical protein